MLYQSRENTRIHLRAGSFVTIITLLGFCFELLCCASMLFAEEAQIKVGMILPLTGPAADYGESIINSVELAKRDRPELFRSIRFIYEDAAHDPKQAVTVFEKLRVVDRVDLIYAWGVPFCKALAPMAEARKIPFFGQCIDRDSSVGRQYVVRFMNHTDQYLTLQTAYLEKMGYKRIGVILSEQPYLEEMYAALQRNIRPGQSVQVIDRYHIRDQNMRSSVSKIRHSDYDVIAVFLYPGQIKQFYRQAQEQALQLPTFGTNFFESLSELERTGRSMDGAIFVNNTVKSAFVSRYESEFQQATQIGFGALAYEFASLVGSLLGNADRMFSAEEILRRFRLVGSRAGTAAGPYEFRTDGGADQYFYFPLGVKRVSSGTISPCTTDTEKLLISSGSFKASMGGTQQR